MTALLPPVAFLLGPEFVACSIGSLLLPRDLSSLCQCSKELRSACMAPALWRDVYRRYFAEFPDDSPGKNPFDACKRRLAAIDSMQCGAFEVRTLGAVEGDVAMALSVLRRRWVVLGSEAGSLFVCDMKSASSELCEVEEACSSAVLCLDTAWRVESEVAGGGRGGEAGLIEVFAGAADGMCTVLRLDPRTLPCWSAAVVAELPTPAAATSVCYGDAAAYAGLRNGHILAWRLADGKLDRDVEAHPGGIAKLVFEPVRRRLVSSAPTCGELRVWDARDMACVLSIQTELFAHGRISSDSFGLLPFRNQLVFGTTSGQLVHVDMATGELVGSTLIHPEGVSTFSACTRVAVVASGREGVHVADIARGRVLGSIEAKWAVRLWTDGAVCVMLHFSGVLSATRLGGA